MLLPFRSPPSNKTIHYVLVHPDYQGKGIAGEMLERIKEKYKNYL